MGRIILTEDEQKQLDEEEKKAFLEERKRILKERGKERAKHADEGLVVQVFKGTAGAGKKIWKRLF